MLTFASIQAAAERIAPHVKQTPVLTSSTLDTRTGAQLFFKAEHRQVTGAFKARGATNAILSLSAEIAALGVVTHSSGNHAAAVAFAANLRGISAHIVMPANVSRIKRENVLAHDGIIVDCEPSISSREETAARVLAAQGGTLIHPYNDLDIMAGQGTAALEFLHEYPDLDLILCPVGGGGLLSGTAVAAKALNPAIRIIGTEPAAADDAAQSFKAGKIIHRAIPPTTVADGLRGALGTLTFAEISTHVNDIVTVTETEIADATALLQQTFNEAIEPSSAVPLAALLSHRIKDCKKLRIGIILTGGNVQV